MNIFNDTPKQSIPRNSIINDDCLEAMKFIEEKSIDLILTDLPFGITQCSFDVRIDLNKLWFDYKRIIKDNGVILLFAATPFNIILGASNLEMLKYEWIWEKTQAVGHLNSKKRPMSAHEYVMVFYNKQPKYNPQMTVGHTPTHYALKKASIHNKSEVYGKTNKDIESGGSTERFPRSVLKFASDKQINKSNGFLHPNQKPIKLIEYLIKTYTNEGDLVLDSTAGSGTVGVACQNLKRDYILIEKELRFFEMTTKRIQENGNK
jgi:site-specific DNA-methyltransferase (adenine-specific)